MKKTKTIILIIILILTIISAYYLSTTFSEGDTSRLEGMLEKEPEDPIIPCDPDAPDCSEEEEESSDEGGGSEEEATRDRTTFVEIVKKVGKWMKDHACLPGLSGSIKPDKKIIGKITCEF